MRREKENRDTLAVVFNAELRKITLVESGETKKEVTLSKMESVLVQKLAGRAGGFCNVFTLLDAWEEHGSRNPSEETIRATVKNVRRKISGFPLWIETLRSRGYRLVVSKDVVFVFLSDDTSEESENTHLVVGRGNDLIRLTVGKEVAGLVAKFITRYGLQSTDGTAEIPLLILTAYSPFVPSGSGFLVTTMVATGLRRKTFRVYQDGVLLYEGTNLNEVLSDVLGGSIALAKSRLGT